MPPTTNSDSEDDPDYVPPNENDSDSSDEQDGVETTAKAAPPKPDPLEQKKQRDALWTSFQASVSAPSNGMSASPQPPPVKRVKIEKTYLFAGKHVTDVVEVPEDSEDAKKWPRWLPRPPPASDAVPTPPPAAPSDKERREGKDDSPAPPPAVIVDTSAAVPPTTAASTPAAKRPGPRKPRTALPSIPKVSQPKKITTLDKSAMDWRAHVASQSSDLQDELDSNRHGGGYLEKVEFLKRVEDRREDAFEASKSSKRRKV
ncbi:Bucentaur or craniofacial development domain containing protein [Tylopilus felleus]